MKLYKKDSKGKIRVLEIYPDNGSIIQRSGLVGGKQVEHKSKCKGKNLGKTNETSPLTQAVREVDSKITKKLREGYFHTIKEAEEILFISPMLAHDYKKRFKKIDWSQCFAQPKFDGMRCLAIMQDGSIKLMSRDNVEIITMDHIKDSLYNIYKEGLILDGELYVHGENFQTNMEFIKKYRKGQSENISFHVYDTISSEPFIKRSNLINKLCNNLPSIELVETVCIKNETDLKNIHSRFLEEEYEGTMVRWGNAPYKISGRSNNLLKYKDFIDITCEIISIGPADKRPTWARPEVRWTKPDGTVVEFACGTKMTHEQRENLLANKQEYIGQTAEIRYFEESTNGIPRFPVMVGIRLDK